jgi:hypothetical protein
MPQNMAGHMLTEELVASESSTTQNPDIGDWDQESYFEHSDEEFS